MTARSRQNTRIAVAVLLLLGATAILGINLLFAWGWTDTTTWGSWSKPQTHEQHLQQFYSYLWRFTWPAILGSLAMIIAGVLVFPKRKSP